MNVPISPCFCEAKASQKQGEMVLYCGGGMSSESNHSI